MKKMVMSGLVIIFSVVIVVSFFEPWARAKVSVTKVATGLVESADTTLKDTLFVGKFVSEFTKATKAIGTVGDIEVKTQVSGYDIPTHVNKKSSKIAIALAQILFKNASGLDKKSRLVYLLPILALVCCAMAILGLKNWIAVIVMVIISGAISIGGLYNLFTMNLSSLLIEITICNGLWQTMYGYLLIFVTGIVWVVINKR